MKGVTMLGMPGAGKSTIGKLVAEKIGFGFIDLDVCIQENEGRNHAEILAKNGAAALLKLEEQYVLSLPLENTVFAPGGSIIYSKAAMEKLRAETNVIYLQVKMNELQSRLKHVLATRGIIGLESMSFEQLYEERHPLYENAAHSIIHITNETIAEIERIVLGMIIADQNDKHL